MRKFALKILWYIILLGGVYLSYVTVYWVAQIFKEPNRVLIDFFNGLV